ncbi:MAG TPA: KTSC domain-containing protein [Flavisolibacter sp.]|jgi:hypothetical protein|nr:KTSC domain-containing protein [Flavisolibacter sp.]
MKINLLRSSLLHSVIYDDQKQQLGLIFLNKTTRVYEKITPDVYEELLKASSHGVYFLDHIRGKFQVVGEAYSY